MNDGTFIQIEPLDEICIGTKLELYKNHSLQGTMIHIEQVYKNDNGPSEAQYNTMAEIYAKIYFASGKKKLIIVPHREVDRGITVPEAGHDDPFNYDFNKLYNILNLKYGISISPGTDGITQERYLIHNQAEQRPNYSGPILSGAVSK
jgi:hypothetical protein